MSLLNLILMLAPAVSCELMIPANERVLELVIVGEIVVQAPLFNEQENEGELDRDIYDGIFTTIDDPDLMVLIMVQSRVYMFYFITVNYEGVIVMLPIEPGWAEYVMVEL